MMFRWHFGFEVVALMALVSSAAPHPMAEPVGASANEADVLACSRPALRVIVDVGHTAQAPGAMSARGVPEYEFNLRLATQIERSLIDAGFLRTVLLMTDTAPRAGLFQRAAYANDLPADLFLSIHHDSVPTHLLEKWEYEGHEYRFSDRFPGHSIFISNDNSDRAGSLLFGKLLGIALRDRGLRYTPHYTEQIMGDRRRDLLDAEAGVYRFDELVVLKESKMPAVLLEAGSIVHRDEELLLGTPERRSLIGAAVTEAVETFCASRATQNASDGQPGTPVTRAVSNQSRELSTPAHREP